MALATLVSCRKENAEVQRKGIELTISAEVVTPAESKTTYAYTPSATGKAGVITTAWESVEKITVVSIGEAGITAVDEFTSTGKAGRVKAEFTGIWNGNAQDKVICLYPAISTAAGAARYSGVAIGSTSIGVDYPTHKPSIDVNDIKDYDLMIGDVNISANSASVMLNRKISVVKLGVSGAYPYEYGVYARYIKQLGFSAKSSGGEYKLFASHGAMAATKSTWTDEIVPDSFYGENRISITQLTKEGVHFHYIPILANGRLEAGDVLTVYYREKEYSGTMWYGEVNGKKEKTLENTLDFSPGYVYAINVDL